MRMINNLYDDSDEEAIQDQDVGDTSADNNEDASMTQPQENSMSKSKKSWSKKTTDAVKKAVKNWKGKSSLLAAIGPILLWIFVALVILIIIIGLVMFLVTMPGMVMEQLKALFNKLGNYVACFFGADITKQIDDTEIFDTLDYLEQMGYDLKGFGFLTDYVTSLNDADSYDTSNGAKLDTKTGVIRNDNDKIIYAKSDYIFMYIMSDNYVYTLKNKNLAALGKLPWKGKWFDWLGEFFQGVGTAAYRIGNFLAGPIYDITGVTNAVGETYGKGLIVLWEEKDDIIGKRGDFFNNDSMWQWDKISIDVNTKKLSIARNAFLNANNALEFPLDGWSGRYGMPIEFLLSVHFATMMPDLACDMISSFPTEVNVYLHKISGEATTAFKTASGYVTYEELENALSGVSGRNFLSAAKAWFDNVIINNKEANAVFELGIPHSPECSCEMNATDTVYTCEGKEVFLNDSGKYYYNELVNNDNGTFEYTEKILTDEEIVKVEASEATVGYRVCGKCKSYIKTILKVLRKDNDYSFLAYDPYIANVTDHWYRDVYFVMEDRKLEFVDYDYEYEAMMKERWTLYETDDYGEYVLYELNQDGSIGSRFNGTEEDAKQQDKTVVKKAVTINSFDSEKLEDLGWNIPNGIWMAYKENKEVSGTKYEAMYPDISQDEKDYEIKRNVYVKMEMIGTVLQTGEGQRTETNSKIKKMFLQNNYFRYDGSQETAEIITELRKKVARNHGASNGEYYSSLTDKDLNTSIPLTRNGETKEYKASDYAGKVVLNQDSLNAFSMLENTHTLDADYIYRDFKELIVELGYFTKEELTEETPRLLQWLIPDIESRGFPRRELDKREDEYGTTVHSKKDYDANNRNLLRAMYQKSREDKENGKIDESIQSGDELSEQNVSGVTNVSEISNPVGTINDFSMRNKLSASENISEVVSGMGADFERIAESGDGYDFKVRCGSVEFTHYYQFKGSYAEKTFTWSGKTKTLHKAACGPTSCINLLTGYGQEVNPTDNIVGISFEANINGVKAFMEQYGVSGESFAGIPDSEYKSRIEQAFSEGKPIITLMHQSKTGDSFWTSDGHFVAMLGQDSNGNIITLDSGSSNPNRHTYSGGVDGLLSTIDALWVADKAPDGMMSGSSFEGYKGNEAVVSPVTGVLLEYGTYDTEIDSITGEEYRVNADLKHGVNAVNSIETKEDGTLEGKPKETNENSGSGIVHDKVGYAKILVLDAENYQRLESTTNSSFQGDSLVKIKQNNKSKDVDTRNISYDTDKSKAGFAERLTNEGELGEWTNIDKTIYGYKEFAESYEKYGIAGYVVYIDGFVCELPDEELSSEENSEDDISQQIPKGEKLTLESFKQVTAEDLQGKETLQEGKALKSKYEKDAAYKLASEKATNKLKAESKVKEEASSSIYSLGAAGKASDNTDLTGIFIKEGTVIGRTMTDKELIQNIRKEKNYEYYVPEDESAEETVDSKESNRNKVIGNYIRIMMRDLDKTVVENVEDYMKLDDPGTTSIVAYDAIEFLAGVLTAESGPNSERGLAAAAWVIKNRLDSGKFGSTLEEVLVAPNQFVVVATDPSECVGGYVTKGETISLSVNGVNYYVNAPSDLAIKVAQSVMSGSGEYKNEIEDRCYWKSAETNVDESKAPIQIPPGTGNKFHY